MELSAQEKNFFNGICPSLSNPVTKREREEDSPEMKKARLEEAARTWPRQQLPQPKGKGKGKGKGKSKGKGGQDMSYHDLQSTVQRLSQLTLRHEFALGNLRQDTSMCLFVKPGAEGLIPILFSASEKWNRTQEENPHLIDSSLRIVLMKAFLIELCNRLTSTAKSEESMQAARSMGWLTDAGEWKTLKWDPALEKLQEVPDAPTKTTERLILEANELRKTINAENLYRFQSVYGLRKDHQTSWVKLAIEVSLRNHGEQVWDVLQGWIGSAALHTMGCRLRKATGAKLRSTAEEECANNFVNDLIQGALAEDVNVATEDVTFYESDEDSVEDDVFSLADPSEDEEEVESLDLANVLAKRVVQQGIQLDMQIQ
ncbi:hypothetical protein AK812_SmicGene44580, partial [Symbiodinium microadriaticum]